ncbi:hypothetical protein AAVH_01424 [Aphelenchoides avenae]|nr:hypothetical protein AAVH_01424 [Aphelenchus avenae]
MFGFHSLPLIADGVDDYDMRALVNVAGNCLLLLSSSLHPFVYFALNERVRHYARKIRSFVFRQNAPQHPRLDDSILDQVTPNDKNHTANT